MTVEELLSRISSAELTEWMAYEEIVGPLDVGYRSTWGPGSSPRPSPTSTVGRRAAGSSRTTSRQVGVVVTVADAPKPRKNSWPSSGESTPPWAGPSASGRRRSHGNDSRRADGQGRGRPGESRYREGSPEDRRRLQRDGRLRRRRRRPHREGVPQGRAG